jgi:hypothetical protein
VDAQSSSLAIVGVLLVLGAIWSWSAGLNPYWPVISVVFAGFSLFRSYKAFVEVWRSRLSKRVQIEVTADKDACFPGDVVKASVRVTDKEELDIEEGRVALVCANRYVYQYTSTVSDDNEVYRTKEVTDEVAAADERILGSPKYLCSAGLVLLPEGSSMHASPVRGGVVR